MAKKIFTYRGKTLEELNNLSMNELSELFTSRVRRSIQRGFSPEEKKFIKKTKEKKVIKTHFRNVPILPHMVGKTIKVHIGNAFFDVIIDQEMIGHFLGEFALTRKKTGHSSPGVGAKAMKDKGKRK